jgi:hypothetical protein
MQAPDEIYRAGLRHYAEALYAIRHFERVIIEKTEAVVRPKLTDLAEVFGIPNLLGGDAFHTATDRLRMSRTNFRELWAWIGMQYWIPDCVNCFFGVLVWNERVSAAVCFSGYRNDFREMLNSALSSKQQPHHYQYNYYKDSRETVISTALEETGSLDGFGYALSKLTQAVIDVIGGDLSLRPGPMGGRQGVELPGPQG